MTVPIGTIPNRVRYRRPVPRLKVTNDTVFFAGDRFARLAQGRG